MKRVTVWFDVLSPDTDAWFARWPAAIEGHGVTVDWRPAALPGGASATPWLALLVACAPPGGTPSRWACEQVLRRWRSEPIEAVAASLAPQRDPLGDDVLAELAASSAAAAAHGWTVLPAVSTASGEAFDGLPGLGLFSAWLAGPESHPSETP